MPKVLFIDIDGTLVNYETVIPQSAIDAIRKARSNGHKVYVCTGRSKAEVYENIWNIGLDGMIGGNGAYVEDAGRVIIHQHITEEQCRHIVDWLQDRKHEFYLESSNGLFGSENFEKASEPVLKLYMGRKGKDASNVTVRSIFPNMIFDGELYRDDVDKISFILNSYQDYIDASEEFKDLNVGTWGGAGELALFGDFYSKGITKAHAISVLLEHLGMKQEDTIAFGDAKIDIPMLEYCKIGVAMGNGGDEIKAMADYVTAGVDEDGLYKAFVNLGLI
ncbi:HAD family hydrolase [Oribacterium sp. NK2B42]|uniref:HAD family hydrolase n=1 Tax=Oribacterium sp. NK2B42 TaxID=689781 RepID=UPI0004241F85|nr:HAD family hydrolase [Oribacterium sp. NK2B42]